MIELTQISKTYRMGNIRVPALRDVSLKIGQGEFIIIRGASGSGKSTLLHVLGLLDKTDTGTFHFMGRDVNRLDDCELALLRSETVGFVFQQFHLLPRMSAIDNVALPLVYRRRADRVADPRQLLEQMGLGRRLNHRPNELSGGQQQRVAIARALVNRPSILMADEPTGNLDSASGREILTFFQKLNAEGITVVVVSHEADIEQYARRVIHIQDGYIRSDEMRATMVAAGGIAWDSGLKLSRADDLNVLGSRRQPPGRAEKFLKHLSQAGRSLSGNKMRTGLSALGIVIGVAAVMVMLALGASARSSVTRQFSALGSNRLVVRPDAQNIGGVRQQMGAVSRLTMKQVEQIRERVLQAKVVVPEVRGRGQIVWGSGNANTEVVGTTPGYIDIYAAQPAHGRFFTEEENRSRARVALLGLTVARSLFGKQNPVGEMVKINRVMFQVIGILPAKGATGPRDEDDLVVIPIQTAMRRLMGREYFDCISVSASDSESVGQVQESILKLTRGWPRLPGATGAGYRIDNLASIQAAFSAVARTLALLLASVATISLVVGGIGIMNIMLVSVAERTGEIGLRKAIGATHADIMAQFLIESAVLCMAGGVFGILLGAGATLVLSHLAGWKLGISIWSILLGCGSSAVIGICFGLWPARQAARLNPIDALRHE
ncbi:MAG: ABC transporter permease [Verrucomicrobiae bacterium]|nr:ABC transporter permease [Verrucomicrobiae bacterium]